MSNTFGNALKLSVFGQSHSYGIGFVLDHFPAGVTIDMDEVRAFMARRAPGRNLYSTSRREKDELRFISGIVDGVTCGAPIAAIILNQDVKKKDYEKLWSIPRPGHADFTSWVKYGPFRDKTGGGQFSGRLTASICAAGALAIQFLRLNGTEVAAHIKTIHGVLDEPISWEGVMSARAKHFPAISDEAAQKMIAEIELAKKRGDSVGGIIECMIAGVPAGAGEPMFDGVENRISEAVFAIPAIKGIEFGSGFGAADKYGSENNDTFYVDGEKIKTKTNHSGGILGGITNGMPIVLSCVVKPTPSIALEQESVNLDKKENCTVRVQGRHDPCIVPRAVPCVEAACALAIMDILMESGTIGKGSINK